LFTTDGAVPIDNPIDNNVSEREMKRVVLNRKNSLFVGNTRGGRTAAILASLTSSCRRPDVDPQLYFMQLLVNLSSWPASDLARAALISRELPTQPTFRFPCLRSDKKSVRK
jgi:hypothetical protein